MVVIILEKVSASLRGELSRWLIEPKPGVFIGHVSAMVRDKLWEKCCRGARGGGVIQAWSDVYKRQHTTRALDSLIMGVRVDREGQILRDFHTAGQGAADPYQGHLRADGESVSKGTIISNRYYLTDAMFLVELTGEQELLRCV